MNTTRHIVVVDDNPTIVSSLSDLFKTEGYSVQTASDGFTALAAIRERVPDVLLSDLNMPRMSGFELLSVVRRRFPMIGVIAMSGAYLGGSVPPGVAADRFYAKGSGSIAALFKILSALEHEVARELTRASVPIWIPGVSADPGSLGTVAVGCSECLRTFPHPLPDASTSGEERRCPHCEHCMKLAMVRQSDVTDTTLPPVFDTGACVGEVAFAPPTEPSEPPGQLAA